MSLRRLWFTASFLLCLLSGIALFWPGPNLGTDFVGGTEVEVAFRGGVEAQAVREAVQAAGFSTPDVIRVQDPTFEARYLIRVQEVSTLSDATRAELETALCYREAGACPPEKRSVEVKFSPGGDKITVRFEQPPDLKMIRERVEAVSGVDLREGENNPTIQNVRDHKVEVQLKSKGDQLMDAVRAKLGEEKVPVKLENGAANPLRVEWIGPKAGRQLRDSAIKSIVISLFLIMAYVAFRFDVRFAPGATIALFHDALGTLGILMLLGKEINLSTVAALLTIIGYSVNDTVIVYDRVRENLGILRGASFEKIINVSLSEMLGRTIITNSTATMSLLAFFYWGTGTLKEFALTLVIGFVLGTYSSIYIALPLTWWLDRRFFAKVGKKQRQIAIDQKSTAT